MSFTFLLPTLILLLSGQNWAGCWPFWVAWKKGYSWSLGPSGTGPLLVVLSGLGSHDGSWAVQHIFLTITKSKVPSQVRWWWEVWRGWGLDHASCGLGLSGDPDVLGGGEVHYPSPCFALQVINEQAQSQRVLERSSLMEKYSGSSMPLPSQHSSKLEGFLSGVGWTLESTLSRGHLGGSSVYWKHPSHPGPH